MPTPHHARRIAGFTGIGALALTLGVTGTSTVLPTAAAATHVRTVAAANTGATPAIGTNPPRRIAGHVDPNIRPDFPILFSCQQPGASVTCYAPQQIRHAYGTDTLINAGFTGKGKTIVIIDAFQSPTLRRDLRLFNQVFGLPGSRLDIVAPEGLTPWNPNDGNQVGWSGEISLDVEWAHAIAPAAKIVLVLAKSNQDGDLQRALKYAVDHRLGDVISQSFGEAEACYGINADGSQQPGVTLAAQHAIFEKARREKITVFASAGDNGSTQPTCDGTHYMLAASTPASDPLVTSVGGTQLFANPRSGKYGHEVVWNEESTFGDKAVGGGGFSSVYEQPSYQRRAGSLGGRGVPDVSYDAAINGGVLTAWSAVSPAGTFYIFGGTSSGSPQWAGLTADIAQLNRAPLGFINPALYNIAQWTPGAFHDITVGSNGDVGIGGFTAGKGWDAASGLGTPVVGQLALALAARR